MTKKKDSDTDDLKKWERLSGVSNDDIIRVWNDYYRRLPGRIAADRIQKNQREKGRFRNLLVDHVGPHLRNLDLDIMADQMLDLRKHGLLNLGDGHGPKKGWKARKNIASVVVWMREMGVAIHQINGVVDRMTAAWLGESENEDT